MNKFKKVMLGALSVLTLGLFVATGARVDAAVVTPYEASNETGANKDSKYASNVEIIDDTYLSFKCTGSNVALLVASLGNYSKSIRTNGTDVGFVFTAKKDVEFTVEWSPCDNSGYKASKAWTFTKSDETVLASGTSSNPAAVITTTASIKKNDVATLVCPGNKVAVFKVYYSVADSSQDETASSTFEFNHSFDATKLTATENLESFGVDYFEQANITEINPDSTHVSVYQTYPTTGTVKSVLVKNGGFKFKVVSSAIITVVAQSTSSSNDSAFALFDSNGTSIGCDEDLTKTGDYYVVHGNKDVTMTFNVTSAGTYYFMNDEASFGRGGRVVSISVVENGFNAKLQRQVSTDKTAIRFVGTLEGFNNDALSQIDSLLYTVKVEGYKAFTKETTKVYTSIVSGDITICPAKANTYYCSFIFTDLLTENNSKSLVGKNISAFLTVTLKDGSTIKTNSVGYNIVAA